MKILIAGDLHAADRPPGGRVDDYKQAILDKLGAIATICREQKVHSTYFLGDIFHTKQPNRVSHRLVQELIVAFNQFPSTPYVIPGNHDLGPDGLESIDRQPLGVLARGSAINILLEPILIGDNFKHLEQGAQACIVPRPYSAVAEGVYDGETDPTYYALSEKEEAMGGGCPIVGLAHGSLLTPGDSRPYPHVNVDDIPGMEKYALLVSGHIHEALGVVKVEVDCCFERRDNGVCRCVYAGDTLFANPGSIGRTRRDLPSYTRTVEVLIVTVDKNGVSVEEVELPGVAPALEVFGGRELEEKEAAPSDDITRFVEMLGTPMRADTLSIPELLAEVDVDTEVKAEVIRLLEAVS